MKRGKCLFSHFAWWGVCISCFCFSPCSISYILWTLSPWTLTDIIQTLQRVTQCLGNWHQARLTDGYQFNTKYARLEHYQPNSSLKPLKGKPVNTCILLYTEIFQLGYSSVSLNRGLRSKFSCLFLWICFLDFEFMWLFIHSREWFLYFWNSWKTLRNCIQKASSSCASLQPKQENNCSGSFFSRCWSLLRNCSCIFTPS